MGSSKNLSGFFAEFYGILIGFFHELPRNLPMARTTTTQPIIATTKVTTTNEKNN